MNNNKLIFVDEAIRLIEVLDDQSISNTQSIKTLIIEKYGKQYIPLNPKINSGGKAKVFTLKIQKQLESLKR
ncbi:hypothetical protein G8C92_06515 [Paenibacillus donghaensis]|uniref:hypothetical protein n=1 Tax=Paenibacillus donghaensis TaxID=414771 RepID=UPI0018833E51|nr:hypothetical protein [Paenibacillus donghaensis]MBE9913683.1 hypothetical protein [Paenibacillus donghaensis]